MLNANSESKPGSLGKRADSDNHLGQAYGRNGNLASGGRRFVDKGFGGSGQSLVVE
jgi:hypothetical protein